MWQQEKDKDVHTSGQEEFSNSFAELQKSSVRWYEGKKPQNAVDTWSSHSQALFRRIPWVITKTDKGSVQGNAFLGDAELHQWREDCHPTQYLLH